VAVSEQAALPRGWKEAYRDDEVEVVPCPLCGSDEARDVAVEWTLVVARCGSCGLDYVRRRPRAPEANYFQDPDVLLRKYAPVIREEAAHTRDPNYAELLDRLERFRDGSGGRLLDVGPFMGFFLRRAAQRGWEVVGADPSDTLSALVRRELGLDVRTGYLGELGFDAEFDAVTILDVLEHVPDPVGTLSQARGAVRPGGVVLVKVPHGRWNRLKHRLRYPDAYDAREHVLHFGARTLREAFRRAGLEPVELFVPRPVQGGGLLRRVPRKAIWAAGALIFRLTGRPTALAPDLCLLGRRPDGSRPAGSSPT
jgi:SAM-dependent methyltransferase